MLLPSSSRLTLGCDDSLIGASVTIAISDITSALPERNLSRLHVLQTLFGETVVALKEVLVELTVWQSILKI